DRATATDRRSPKMRETFGRAGWHGRETVPQRARVRPLAAWHLPFRRHPAFARTPVVANNTGRRTAAVGLQEGASRVTKGPLSRGGRSVPSDASAVQNNGQATALLPAVATGDEYLAGEVCLQLFRVMARARALEERMIKMSKSGEGYFWIGGPGEEAFNAA